MNMNINKIKNHTNLNIAISIKPFATFTFEDIEPVQFITTSMLLDEYNRKLNNDLDNLQQLTKQTQNTKVIANLNLLDNEPKCYNFINKTYNNYSYLLKIKR